MTTIQDSLAPRRAEIEVRTDVSGTLDYLGMTAARNVLH